MSLLLIFSVRNVFTLGDRDDPQKDIHKICGNPHSRDAFGKLLEQGPTAAHLKINDNVRSLCRLQNINHLKPKLEVEQ